MAKIIDIYSKLRTPKYVKDEKGEYIQGYIEFRKASNIDKILTKDEMRMKPNTKQLSCILGRSLAITEAIWLIFAQNTKMFTWIKGVITDGYLLVLLSPFILFYWLIASPIYIIPLIIPTIMCGLAWYWTFIFEIPAAFMNKEKIDLYYNGKYVKKYDLVFYAILALIIATIHFLKK